MSVRQQEAAQGAAFGIETAGFVPETDEHLLHDLFGTGVIVEEALGQAETGSGVATVRLCERSLLVPADRHHQGGIGCVGVFPSHVVCSVQSVLPDE